MFNRLICGASLEVNATSDVEFYLSIRQVQLANEIMTHNVLKSINMLMAPIEDDTFQSASPITEIKRNDSTLKGDISSRLLPFDVLLTAGRITLFTYSCEQTAVSLSPKKRLTQLNAQHLQPSSISSLSSLGSKYETKSEIDLTSDSGIGSTATGMTVAVSQVCILIFDLQTLFAVKHKI